MVKNIFLRRVNDISKIHHRAAFTPIRRHISKIALHTYFLELASERYSCRSFSDIPVSSSKINAILEAARKAPSAKNNQPVHIWTITGKEALDRLHEVHPAFGAPLVFMAGYKADEAWVRPCDRKNSGETDAAIAMTHLMLEAADLGLGGVWIGSFDPAVLAEKFPETQGYTLTALYAAGYPDEKAAPGPRHSQRKSPGEFSTVL